MTAQQHVQQLLDFIDASPSPWHAVAQVEQELAQHQFTGLLETDTWNLQPGGRYYVVRDDSSIIVFVLGLKPLSETGFKIVGAHTDSPGLRIKPNAASCSDSFVRLAVDIYGGPILATFTDRDLSLAGRISYQDDHGKIASCLLRFDQPLVRLPNLAIHMNRSVNEDGLKLHKQQELGLLLSSVSEQLPQRYFADLLQTQSGIVAKQLLSWDLAVYDTQKGSFWGAENQFYANSQLDNLASCHAALRALLNDAALNADATLLCAFFDHEEIGSESTQGANGSFLPDILQRIAWASQIHEQDYLRSLAKSFMVSADMAHAYQPNFPNAYDAQHKVFVNQGPVIKVNANHRYSSESISEAQFALWCQQVDVPYQKYSHRCDLPCGSTIGPIVSAKLGIRTVDVGCPMWAMHSLRESAGVFDHEAMIKVLRQFFISAI